LEANQKVISTVLLFIEQPSYMSFKHHTILLWSILHPVLGILAHSQAKPNTHGIIVIVYGIYLWGGSRFLDLPVLESSQRNCSVFSLSPALQYNEEAEFDLPH